MELATNRNIRRLLWMQFKYSNFSTPKRYRYKPKWAVHEKPSTHCQLALKNFDAFYKPVYGKDWPFIRLSLLSLPKYSAAVNKYGNVQETQEKLYDIGAADFLLSADMSSLDEISPGSDALNVKAVSKKTPSSGEFMPDEAKTETHLNNLSADASHNDDLNVFVPTEKVYSESELLYREEVDLNAFESRDISAVVLPAETLDFSKDLRPFVFCRGDVSSFPSPTPYNGILGYYLMDAASTLPVLALNVKAEDRVLDLCAAPGGKAYLILQSLDLYGGGRLHCNDSSKSRLTRLKSVLKLFYPKDICEQVYITKMEGTSDFPTVYNKVLIDAPCNSDRHVVTEDENNLFKVSRTRERLGLTKLQKDLLISGIKSCVQGGTIVYSTCTLSPAQNDGVIQAAVEELYETSDIEIAVQDLSNLRYALRNTFKFHKNSKHGLTVLPNVFNNFGPSYVAKLRRIK